MLITCSALIVNAPNMQPVYHSIVTNTWLTYLNKGIYTACHYVCLEITYLLLLVLPHYLLPSYFLIFSITPPALSPPPPPFCWGGCTCYDFDKVVSMLLLVCGCVRACVHARLRACARVCVCVSESVRAHECFCASLDSHLAHKFVFNLYLIHLCQCVH